MNEGKRLIKNTGLIAIGSLSTKVVAFLLLPLYTSILSAGEYGTVDYIVSIATFCIPFVSFLMDEAIFRFLIDCKTDEERRTAVSSSIALVLLGNIILILIGTPIMILIKYRYAVYTLLYVITAVVTQMTSSLLRGMGKTNQYVLLSFMVSVTVVIMNILLIAVLRVGLVGMLISYIVAHSVIPLFFQLRFKLWKYIKISAVSKAQIKTMFKYSMPLIPNKISWSIINLSDRIIIKNVIGSTASGFYAAAYKFPNLVDTVYGFFYQSWKESSARALHDSGADVFYNSIYKYLRNFMFALVVGFTAFMPIIFNILINKSYNEAMVYVPPLILSTYFANMSGFYGGIFTAYKDTKIMGTTTIVAALINLTVHLALIKFIGLYAAAFSTFAADFIVYLYRKAKVRKYIKLEGDIKMSILAVVVIAVVWALFYSGDMRLYIAGYVIAVVYAIVINRKMLSQVMGMVKRKVKKS